jgi:hypothetical protein
MTPHSNRCFLGTLLGLVILLSGCAHCPGPLTNQKSKDAHDLSSIELLATSNQKRAFVSHNDWVGMQLAPEPFFEIRERLEKTEGPLKNRGEAHVTILTPPEFKSFGDKLSINEIEAGISDDVQAARWTSICLGQGNLTSDPKLKTFFIVIDSPDLVAIRHKIKIMANLKNTGRDFNPEAYTPHITVGFTERDLHLQDGVIKDRSACPQTK